MTRHREPLRLGLDVDTNAVRFANLFHVLRELVHLTNGWLALEPRIDVKFALGDHVHDDARAVTKCSRRMYELRHPSAYPGAPGPELVVLLDRMATAPTPEAYLQIAYGEIKPMLVRAIELHLAAIDELTDEPSLRLLTQLLDRQRRHVEELRRFGVEPHVNAERDAGALPIDVRGRRRLRIFPPLDEPRRDDFVEVTERGDPFLRRELYVNGEENHVPTDQEEQRHFFHGLMDAELCAAELMARNSHEHPELPWDFHVDMARQTWDEIRHAEVHDRLMATELGCRWGDYPVGFSYFRSIYAHDLLGRLALFNSTSEQKAMWRHSHRRRVLLEQGQEQVAKVFDYLLADEVPHVHNGLRWGAFLMEGDEAAYKARVHELRGEGGRAAGLDRVPSA